VIDKTARLVHYPRHDELKLDSARLYITLYA